MKIEQRIAQMGESEAQWFSTLRSCAGRAMNGPADGVAMTSLQDDELERVFGNCAAPRQCINAVSAWRDSGRSLQAFLRLAAA